MTLNEILRQCRIVLEGHYGWRFKGLILYGSVARDQASPTSDLDLLVLLNPPVDYFEELHQIIEVLYPIQLESERLISAKPASVDEYEKGRIQLYRNARREGVAV